MKKAMLSLLLALVVVGNVSTFAGATSSADAHEAVPTCDLRPIIK